MKQKAGIFFIVLALVSLAGGAIFGVTGAFQFLFPSLSESLPFYKVRPLHVSLVVGWIFFASIGGIYYYLPSVTGIRWKFKALPVAHFLIVVVTGIAVLFCYITGRFGGREYWEFPPALAVPVVLGWFLLLVNFFRSVAYKGKPWPVYLWMWATGIFFFLFTFLEAYLWMIPSVGKYFVRDMTVQWKAYGALTGSWNMLVYGTAIFLMARLKGSGDLALSRKAFFMYFLGLTNLMFGWAHHIYPLPTAGWIRYMSYMISMTELLVLASIIRNWKVSVSEARKDFYQLPYRFIISSDIWIFINLIVAILISIPAINVYTHGTHVTVAHAMGSTIGINTMILLASCTYLFQHAGKREISGKRTLNTGLLVMNVALLVFFLSLLAAGVTKGVLTLHTELRFQEIMEESRPFLHAFAWSGLLLLTGIFATVAPLLHSAWKIISKNAVAQEVKTPSLLQPDLKYKNDEPDNFC